MVADGEGAVLVDRVPIAAAPARRAFAVEGRLSDAAVAVERDVHNAIAVLELADAGGVHPVRALIAPLAKDDWAALHCFGRYDPCLRLRLRGTSCWRFA